jgi:hypothetical protein
MRARVCRANDCVCGHAICVHSSGWAKPPTHEQPEERWPAIRRSFTTVQGISCENLPFYNIHTPYCGTRVGSWGYQPGTPRGSQYGTRCY